MTPTTDLSPATDATAMDVRAVEPQQPGSLSSLTLYALANDLVSLLSLREEMAGDKDGTAVADAAIAEYMAALPTKVDAVVHVLRTLDSQAELAAAEVQRLNARRRSFASAAERLKQYCCAVLEQLPKPKRGSRKLEGDTATLILKANGGVAPLDIYDEALVPDEYKTVTVTMPSVQYAGIREHLLNIEVDILKESAAVDNAAVRKALDVPCWLCEGKDAECVNCGGTGKEGVPGARLLDRSAHLEIR